MKQRSIQFSAMFVIFLLSGIGCASAEPISFDIGNMSANITYNKANVIPGDVVTIAADFNRTISAATISVNNSYFVLEDNVSMTPVAGTNDLGGSSFEYEYEIPPEIIIEPLDLNVSAFDSSKMGSMIVDDAFEFNVSDYLSIDIALNRTGTFRPGDIVNITANFSKPVDHANISIGTGLPGVSNVKLVGADSVTGAPMDKIDGDTFAYNYPIPADANGPLDIGVSGYDDLGNLLGDGSFPGEIGVGDPYITVISPNSEFANEKCVKFNFTAYDSGYGQTGGEVTYTFYLDGIAKNNGVITSGSYKKLEFELADGSHTWEVKTRDNYGSVHTTGSRVLYVDTKCPSVKLVSPLDCSKEVINDATEFNFTCEDALAAQYTNLGLTYTLYIDGQVAKRYGGYGNNITGTASSGVPVTEEVQLTDGAHNWSVSVQDGAGNSANSEVRKFYVDLNGLTVNIDTPDGGYVSANPTFNFTVTGNTGDNGGSWPPFEIGNESGIPGAGLPFTYKLLVNGKEVAASCDCDCDCKGGYSGHEGENGCVKCTEGKCDGSCFVVGKDIYSIKASVPDGINKNWTVVVTDSTTGKTYQPSVKYFSVDSVAPACVANLKVEDTPGETNWTDLNNSPGLYVSWNASTDKDLDSKPYGVFISTSKPSCIEDMEQVTSTSDTSLTIKDYVGKPLIYGKDYWVAVIARDNASNYDKSFSMCGPVRTYEDMNITLDDGWNLKSVPKRLAASYDCSESVFGEDSTVLYWDGSCWQFPETIEPCKGYWVYTNESCTYNVKLKGMSSDSGKPDVPASLTLCPGWHMIGHTSAYAAPWNMTLASLSDSGKVFNGLININSYKFSNLITYGGNEGWGGIIPEMTDSMSTGELQYMYGTDSLPVGALQSDSYMVPGQGYWIFIKNEGTYASIENVYNMDILKNGSGGTDNGGFPDNFDPNDPSTWPDGFDLNDPSTWPEGFDPSAQG